MITLGLDTSEALGGVALLGPGGLCSERSLDEPVRYAERLLSVVRELLDESRRAVGEIGTVSVNLGPGSFTGLRIGLATAKGICQALRIPLSGVDGSFVYRSLAASASRVCVVIPSRRDLVYVRWFVGVRPRGPTVVLRERDLDEKLRQEPRELTLVGSGAAAAYERMSQHGGVRLGQPEALRPSAATVGRLGMPGAGDGVYRLEPIYVESMPVETSRER
ncbi:MAG: tRNA (adenosine(37)-N6)-threonylcarbamoyltransferase complex dimerization subunit type 1 TsaB [Candidatus Bipolaricaulis sp.]|nr:tRNA (adenosine(37)-N6)-threonylcarbamoyltransferase complex dimerization subunit type 1 TsaB [Candidatus Bipolaricaulis sp.]MDD5219274.1 tRNA (adenosine(37)-N6)-threonylcarbamoyltransferase complex dimerization subunit type 1 TsaB [Candidatus Bipolaricaulis sp.]